MTMSLQTGEVFPGGDRCHFETPVRFGRRRTDQVGHLLLTSQWLQFRGTVDLSIAWDEVAAIEHTGRDLVIMLHRSSRTVRFCCQTDEEAARAAVTARHLSALAQTHPLEEAT
jgi:hypothetical protein